MSFYVDVWATNDYHWTHFASVYYCTKLSESFSEQLFGFMSALRYEIPAVSEFVYTDTLGHRFCWRHGVYELWHHLFCLVAKI